MVIIFFLPVRIRQLAIFSRNGKDQVEYSEPLVSWLERWLTEKDLELGDKGRNPNDWEGRMHRSQIGIEHFACHLPVMVLHTYHFDLQSECPGHQGNSWKPLPMARLDSPVEASELERADRYRHLFWEELQARPHIHC